jgi:hypothetical protein
MRTDDGRYALDDKNVSVFPVCPGHVFFRAPLLPQMSQIIVEVLFEMMGYLENYIVGNISLL